MQGTAISWCWLLLHTCRPTLLVDHDDSCSINGNKNLHDHSINGESLNNDCEKKAGYSGPVEVRLQQYKDVVESCDHIVLVGDHWLFFLFLFCLASRVELERWALSPLI